MALALSGTSNGSLNNLSLSANTGTIVDTARAGGIIQVQTMLYTSSSFSTTSTSFVDVTGFSFSITPTSSSNKILCFVDALLRTTGGFHENARSEINLVRGSTVINNKFVGQYIGNQDGNNMYIPTQIIFLDSPATTSSTTYKIQIESENSNFTTAINPDDYPSITLMEVVA